MTEAKKMITAMKTLIEDCVQNYSKAVDQLDNQAARWGEPEQSETSKQELLKQKPVLTVDL